MTTPRCERGIEEAVTVVNRSAVNIQGQGGNSHEYHNQREGNSHD